MIIGLVIYVLGYITSYLTGRFIYRTRMPPYTISDRIWLLIVSLLSWIAVIANIIILADFTIDTEKEAKW